MNNKVRLVGIMVANRLQRKYVLSQYMRYRSANLKLFSFTPSSIDWNRRSVVGLTRSNGRWVARRFPFPQAVYNRCYATDPALIQRLGETIGADKIFNDINQLNKLDIYNSLSRWLYDYLPATILYDKEMLVHALADHKEIYLKPFYGHQGRGVYRAERKDTGDIHLCHHYFAPKTVFSDAAMFQENVHALLGSTPYIIQRGIPIKQINGQVFDIRSLVQKNDRGEWSVTNLISRIAFKGSYNTSIFVRTCLSQEVLAKLYPPDRVQEIMTSIYNVSLRTAEIIDTSTNYHLGEFSVDFALDNDAHPWIIELNGKPQKNLYRGIRKRGVVYMRPIQYAKFLCSK